jgi:RND family efflux transporter MFP subunit
MHSSSCRCSGRFHWPVADSAFGVFVAILVSTVVAVLLSGCQEARPNDVAPPDLRPVVSVISVAGAAHAGAVRASGLVGYKRETELSFNAPGVILSLLVDEGDHVAPGQQLASMRRTSVGSNPGEAAQARENAERLLARNQALFEKGFVSQTAVDDARLAVERAQESTVLIAPSAGVILRRKAEPAQMVNAGAPVLVLGETGQGIVVRAAVASRGAARVRTGNLATVRVNGTPSRRATVVRVAAKSDDATGAFEVEVRPDDPVGMRSGQVAEVEIATAGAEDSASALIVPALSLLDGRADQGIVFVVDGDNIARRRAVQTAGIGRDGVLVIEGLAIGDRVVAAGAAYVRDGEPVRIAEPG